MRSPIIIAITLLVSATAFSQSVAENAYWFYFSDKDNNTYQLDKPEEFLSDRSIDRRAWQSLPIDETDLPVSQVYIDSLGKLNLEIKHVSKWLNGVLVLSTDTVLIDTLCHISFIDSIRWMPILTETYFPGVPTMDRFEPALNVPPSYSYGPSLTQVSQVKANFLHQKGYTGAGVHVAVLDVGFLNMPELPAFQKMYDQDQLLDSRNFVDKALDAYQSHGHGTNVSSIIAGNWTDTLIGTAPDATLILALTENADSETKVEEFAWIEAAEWVDSLGADIINTSLGYTQFDDENTNYIYEDMDGETAFISRASGLLTEKGILSVTSAGNSGNDPWYYIGAPGDASDILTVGAVDSAGAIASFSSRGPTYDHRIKPEIVAKGVATIIQSHQGNAAAGNGTSFSSPVIAGAAASLWQAYPSMPVKDLIRAIIESSDRSKNPDATYGYGIPDFGKAFNVISSAPTSEISVELKAYPNPFREYLNIELPIISSDEYQIRFYDVQGREIFYTFDIVPVRIDIPGSLPPGMYIIELKNDKNTYRGRIIKN